MQKEFKKSKGAAYVSDVKINSRGNKITKPFTIGTSFIAIFVILFGVFFTTPNVNIQSGDAAFMGFLCNNKTLGHNMKVTPNLHKLSVVPFMDATGRTWTLEEAYGGNLSFVNYYGETLDEPAGFLLADTDDLDKRAGFAHEEAIKTLEDNKDKLMAERTIAACTIDNLPLFIGTFLYMIASFIMNLITIFVTFAFDSGFICKKAEQSNCVDLVNVIGGSGSSTGGIIGTLTSNIYIPLAVIAIAIAAFSILYQGIVKRQFRQAFGYLAWILLAFIFGLMALLNPNLLARAPMVAANSIAGCIIGAFNGDNCFSSSSTDAQLDLSGANTSGAACKSAATGATDPADILSMSINSMACSIWKAFILQSQISAEFGVPFEELDVESETMKPLIEASGVPADTFCVGRYTAESYSEAQKTKPIQFTKNNSEICNLGVYQKYLQTNANSPGATAGFGVNPDPRWYNLMAVIIQDDEMWNTWNPDLGGGMTRLISGFVAIVSVIAGGIVLITISIYAMVYYISAIILMALAPLFLLFALQPTKGKKIFLGWVEKVISNLLKYLASAFFLLIALAFYSAVFGNLTNPMVTLIFIIILSIALFMYRKEITELIGRVNMGGEQFSNKFAGLADKSKKFAKVTAGSAIGAAVSTGGAKALVSKDAWAAAATGAGSGAMRELSRGSGVIGNAARQANRMRAQSTNEFKKEEAANLEEGKALEAAEENQKEVVANHQEEAEELKTQIEDKEKAAEELTGEIKTKAEGKVLHELKVDLESGKFEAGSSEENFAKFMLAAEAIKDLQAQRDQAHEDGDFDRAKDLTGEINTRMEEADGLKAQIPNDDFERLTDEFNNNVQNEVNVSMENNTELSSILEQREVLNAQFNDAQDRVINAERDRIQISAQRVQNQATRDHLGKVNDRIRRGGTVGAATIKRAKKKAEKQSADGYDAYIADQSVSSQVFSDAYKAKAGANSTYTPNSDFETNAEDIMVGEKIGQETLRDANSGHQTKFKEQNREAFAKYATNYNPIDVPPVTPSVVDKSGSGPNVLPSPPHEATSQQSVEDVHADNLRGNVNNSSTDTQPAQSPLARAAAANKPISNNDTSRNSDIDRDNPLQSVLNQEDTSTKETDREFAPIPVGTPKQQSGTREQFNTMPVDDQTGVESNYSNTQSRGSEKGPQPSAKNPDRENIGASPIDTQSNQPKSSDKQGGLPHHPASYEFTEPVSSHVDTDRTPRSTIGAEQTRSSTESIPIQPVDNTESHRSDNQSTNTKPAERPRNSRGPNDTSSGSEPTPVATTPATPRTPVDTSSATPRSQQTGNSGDSRRSGSNSSPAQAPTDTTRRAEPKPKKSTQATNNKEPQQTSGGKRRKGGVPRSPATRVDTQPKATTPADSGSSRVERKIAKEEEKRRKEAEKVRAKARKAMEGLDDQASAFLASTNEKLGGGASSSSQSQSSQTNRDVGDSRRSSSNSSPTPSPMDTTRRAEPKPKKNTQATSSSQSQATSEGRERRGGLPHSPATRADTQPKDASPAPAEPTPSQPAPQSSQTNRDVGDSRRSSSNSSPTPSPIDTTRRAEPKPKKMK